MMRLSKQTSIIAGAAGAILMGLLVLYAPLISRLGKEGAKCRAIESEANQARNMIKLAKVSKVKRDLVAESDASLAMDELTKLAKQKSINCLSVIPKNSQIKEMAGYKVLPIEMAVTSTYKQLGIFLGSLDKFTQSVITVESFSAALISRGKDELRTKLTVNVHLSN